MNLPSGHQTIMPYLIVKGALQFIDFVKNVFETEDSKIQPLREDGTVMHAEVTINGSTIMVTDETTDWQKQPANLFIYVTDADETYQKALDHGATTLMGLSDQDYGRTCGVLDSFGNTWWITSVIK